MQRESYAVLHAWLRLVLRLGLAAQMFAAGVGKIIPVQFPAPSLLTLVTPSGNLSLQELLWTMIGAATPYQIFTGTAEVMGGILLLLPRTSTLGALVSLANLVQTLALNTAYAVDGKLSSIFLVLIALGLLAPEFPRLADLFLRNRATQGSTQRPLFRSQPANRAALAAQILFGVCLIGIHAYTNLEHWRTEGGGSPRSPLYGIWNVEKLAVNGDEDRRWRRILFDSPDSVVFQRTDDSFERYEVAIDGGAKALSLRKADATTATLTFQRPAADRLILDGEMDGDKLRIELQLVEFDTFRLLNSGFRWFRAGEP